VSIDVSRMRLRCSARSLREHAIDRAAGKPWTACTPYHRPGHDDSVRDSARLQDEHTICVDKVRFVGDPVAAVRDDGGSRDRRRSSHQRSHMTTQGIRLRRRGRSRIPSRASTTTATAVTSTAHRSRVGDAAAAIAAADLVREDLFFLKEHAPADGTARRRGDVVTDGKLTLTRGQRQRTAQYLRIDNFTDPGEQPVHKFYQRPLGYTPLREALSPPDGFCGKLGTGLTRDSGGRRPDTVVVPEKLFAPHTDGF